jgi:TFIIF-interacting CTD phosphatase-like protein
MSFRNVLNFKHKAIILDLDECLIRSHIESDPKEKNIMSVSELGNRKRYFEIKLDSKSFWGIKRPDLDKFLAFCDKYFSIVIIWSAGEKTYVNKIVKEIFRDHRQPDLILTREDCVHMSNVQGDYHKPISKIKEYFPDLDEKLILALDDKKDNFRDNMDNGIHIPRFAPRLADGFNTKDGSLSNLIHWLMSDEVMTSNDVRNLDKSRIFRKESSELDKYSQHLKHNHNFLFAPMRLS